MNQRTAAAALVGVVVAVALVVSITSDSTPGAEPDPSAPTTTTTTVASTSTTSPPAATTTTRPAPTTTTTTLPPRAGDFSFLHIDGVRPCGVDDLTLEASFYEETRSAEGTSIRLANVSLDACALPFDIQVTASGLHRGTADGELVEWRQVLERQNVSTLFYGGPVSAYMQPFQVVDIVLRSDPDAPASAESEMLAASLWFADGTELPLPVEGLGRARPVTWRGPVEASVRVDECPDESLTIRQGETGGQHQLLTDLILTNIGPTPCRFPFDPQVIATETGPDGEVSTVHVSATMDFPLSRLVGQPANELLWPNQSLGIVVASTENGFRDQPEVSTTELCVRFVGLDCAVSLIPQGIDRVVAFAGPVDVINPASTLAAQATDFSFLEIPGLPECTADDFATELLSLGGAGGTAFTLFGLTNVSAQACGLPAELGLTARGRYRLTKDDPWVEEATGLRRGGPIAADYVSSRVQPGQQVGIMATGCNVVPPCPVDDEHLGWSSSSRVVNSWTSRSLSAGSGALPAGTAPFIRTPMTFHCASATISS